MRTRVYSIPTDRGAIEVSKGAFLTIAKRNQQLANQQRKGIKRAKAKPKPASKAVIGQGKSLGIKKVGRLGGLKKKVSLSSSVRNSGREWPNQEESTWSNINMAVYSMSLSLSAAHFDYVCGYR